MSPSIDASSHLQRRRPAPLHLHTSNSEGPQHGEPTTSTSSVMSGGSGGPSGQSSRANEDDSYVAGGGGGGGGGGGSGSAGTGAGANASGGNVDAGGVVITNGSNQPFGTPPFNGNGGQYLPPSLPHSHSMPIPTSQSYYSSGIYHAAPYSAGPTSSSFGSGAQTQAPMSAPPIAPYNPPYADDGSGSQQPPSIIHSQSAPAVPLSASIASTGALSSPIYGNYPPPASPFHNQATGQYRQGPPSSSPYSTYPYTPQYGSFSYDHPSSATSATHDAAGQGQSSDYGDRGGYRSSAGVTASGQRYPAYQAKVPLVDRPFKCDECVQSFNRNHDLKRHKRIHLAVKPFSCDKCGKQFSRKDALRRHWLVKGCRGDEEASGVNSHLTGPPPALSPTTPDTPSYPLSAPALPNSSHNPYFPHISPAPPTHSTPASSMVRQYSAGTILVTPKDEHAHQYQSSTTAGPVPSVGDAHRKHSSFSISSTTPGSASQWYPSTTSNGNVSQSTPLGGISPTSSGVSYIPASKYAAAPASNPRSASSGGGAGRTEGGVLASQQGGRSRADGGDGGLAARSNSWAPGGGEAGTGHRVSLGGWQGGPYPGEGPRRSWNGGENGGERRLAEAELSSRHEHVFREPFPSGKPQQLSADQQRWSSIEMIPSSSTSSDPSIPDVPSGPSMSMSYSYPGAQQSHYSQQGHVLTESEEQHMMGQQGGSSQWQRWHRPSFPFPVRNGNIYQAPPDGSIPEQEEAVRDHRLGSMGVDVVS